ncbi:DUF1573 domain-containing protein [Prolixibacteraceae bacterium Z1-6]|uniref:DUF1573 domain-containing protein n=1 Tax=Draconibacterium aestuarii TaxID=2998507 RepID=A0A9X3J6M1_9BACT|nr:DUF1573 domain-containing protein [Prolixibacteraceae bacterium Z1-6]
MRAIGLFLAVLILFGCAQQQKNEAPKELKDREITTIEFKEEMHSFGELSAGEIVVFTFEFTNTGATDYWIEEINSDCGCVKTNYKKEAVKPGKNGRIELEFDTSGLIGREFKTIEIIGNSKELKHLAIFAEVKNEILDIKY